MLAEFKNANVADTVFQDLPGPKTRDTSGRAFKPANLSTGVCSGKSVIVRRMVAHNGAALQSFASHLRPDTAGTATLARPKKRKRKLAEL